MCLMSHGLKQGGLACSKRSELAPNRLIAALYYLNSWYRLKADPPRFKTSRENEVNFRDIGNGHFDCPQNKIRKQ